jgi:Flp pilus assembly protein TadG
LSRHSPPSKRGGLRRDESGQSTVELALALPMLLVVLIGAVQFALVHHAENVADTATAEGARLAAGEGNSLLDGAVRTRSVLESGLGPTGAAFVVTAEDRGETVVAHASGEYRLFIPWVSNLAITIESSSEVRKEGFRSGP